MARSSRTQPNATDQPSRPQQQGTGDLHSDEALDALAERLRELGAESEGAARTKQVVSWMGSFAVHAALITAAFLLITFAVFERPDEEVIVVDADFYQLNYEPLAMMNPNEAMENQRTVQDRVRSESVADTLSEELSRIEVDPLSMISDAAGRTEVAEFAPQPRQGTARFAGLTGTNARRIVFIVDASGSMIGTLQIVIEELARSVGGMVPEQEFGIIFFQQNEAHMVPPVTELTSATEAQQIRALTWIDEHIVPRGRSNPLEAIRKGLSLEPDVIFMLSNNITGSGQFEIDQADLLAMLDELNPRDPETGQRPSQIQCIQFLDPDPLDTLKKIAQRHSGPDGYRFLSRAELGLIPE